MDNKIKTKLDKTHKYHQHIDNGGVTVEIKDLGVDKGIVLRMDAEYHGHPSFQVQMRLDSCDFNHTEFLEGVAKLFIKATEHSEQISIDILYQS